MFKRNNKVIIINRGTLPEILKQYIGGIFTVESIDINPENLENKYRLSGIDPEEYFLESELVSAEKYTERGVIAI